MFPTIGSKVTEWYAKQNEAGDEEWLTKRRLDTPRLHISALGGCVRRGYYQMYEQFPEHPLSQRKTNPFTDNVRERMQLGKELEERSRKALEEIWQCGKVQVYNNIWLGEIDFVVQPCKDFPDGAIIEHKGTAPWNFKGRLPYLHHCYQVLGYQKLYQWMHGIYLPAYLYYRVWNIKAEFLVYEYENTIYWEGINSGRPVDGGFTQALSTAEEMARFEEQWGDFCKLPNVPYSNPFEKGFACVDRRKYTSEIACSYFSLCWPEYGAGELETPEEYR